MRRSASLAVAVAALAVLFCAAGARADVFGPISLLSSSSFGQAEYAHDPVVSEDGGYVVFDGSVGGVIGVWRRGLAPGSPLEQVAGGDAVLPSVSADGRYVSFTTNEGARLPALTDGQIHSEPSQRESPGVYVRDMAIASTQPGAFTLASAKNGSTQSLHYEYHEPAGTTPEERQQEEEQEKLEEERLGATAAGRSAISADGRSVAFVTTAASDLAGPGTPPMQVAVRRLDTHETQLVSVRFDPATGRPAVDPETGRDEPVSEEQEGGVYGAAYSTGTPPPFEAAPGKSLSEAYQVPQLAGASISADGTTVAWLGQRIDQQARTLSEETLPARYAEPLWRRIAGGEGEPTRRVTGGSEPESPGCLAHPEGRLPLAPSASDPCQGPFATQTTGGLGTWNNSERAAYIPKLSADGYDVAFIASAPLLASAGGFGLGGAEFNDDAYWVNMREPTRRAALAQLTEFASGEQDRPSTNGQIEDIAISADGTQVAFTSRRTVFPLGAPAYVSVPAAVPGLMELYDVDLSNETLTRVTRGYEGGGAAHPESESGNEDPYQHNLDGALSPSFGLDGAVLAFSSTASNLVYGDGNTPPLRSASSYEDGADAFAVDRITFGSEPALQSISPSPPNPSPHAPWRLSVLRAVSLADGSVRLELRVPAAGALGVAATSRLPSRSGHSAGRRTVRRTVAHQGRRVTPNGQGVVTLTLSLAGGYKQLAARSHGLAGKATVSFVLSGHPTLRATVPVTFKRKKRKKR